MNTPTNQYKNNKRHFDFPKICAGKQQWTKVSWGMPKVWGKIVVSDPVIAPVVAMFLAVAMATN